MSQKGYYRYKLEGLTKGITNVTFYVNALPFVTHKVIARETCIGWRQLKWLDENGQYRFFAFLELYSIKDTSKSIGKTSNFIESLLSTQSDTKNIGQSTDRSVVLRAINVTSEERSILSSLGNSPRVFLYVGDFTKDEKVDYVQVEVKTDGIALKEKPKTSNYEVTVMLPKYYNQTML